MEQILVYDDGTRLAASIAMYLASRGYHVRREPIDSLLYQQTPLPAQVRTVVFCNGEHYGPLVSRGAGLLNAFVEAGGALIAMPWSAWSASRDLPLAVRMAGRYRESYTTIWRWHKAGLTAPETPFALSFEELAPLPGATVLIEDITGMPMLVERPIGPGLSLYLNATSHTCASNQQLDLWSSIAPAFQLALSRIANHRAGLLEGSA